MIIANPDLATNTLKVLPRYYSNSVADVTITITNEDTRQDVTQITTNILKSDGFLYFRTDANFINNSTYRLKIFDNTESQVIFRGKIFATTQSKQNYLIHG